MLADYAAVLRLLSEPYPQARLLTLSGAKGELAKVQRESDERMKKISVNLRAAAGRGRSARRSSDPRVHALAVADGHLFVHEIVA